VIEVRGVTLGGSEIALMAGPCAVESREQIHACAAAAARAGAAFLRGGGFKTRTSPHSFQGLGIEGVKLLREAADAYRLRTVTEVLDGAQLEAARRYIDVAQIGSRNMQNVSLLRELGRSGLPVLLKRGFGATVDEWLAAAEYILTEGNHQVLLCERGIRTFETCSRFTLDLAAVPVAKARTGLPVVVDPSHPAGDAALVEPLALAAVAAGADGLLVEIHPSPANARSDARQALSFEAFQALVEKGRAVAAALGRHLGQVNP
jgi:3-deoxy-7-phosphoheptulonate synthase